MFSLVSVLTEITETNKIDLNMELSETAQRFIQHWGDMGGRWGANRTVAQIHALLYLVGGPVHAEDMAETLDIARSNVSNSIKELQSLNLAKRSHVLGARREFYETSVDVWELFRVIVQGRKQREVDPTLELLRELVASPAFAAEEDKIKQRLESMLQMLEVVTVWIDEMMHLPPEKLARVMKLGARVQKFLRSGDDVKE